MREIERLAKLNVKVTFEFAHNPNNPGREITMRATTRRAGVDHCWQTVSPDDSPVRVSYLIEKALIAFAEKGIDIP